MQGEDPGWLRNLWYFALPGSRLGRGRTVAKTLLGEPVLIGRTAEGAVFALRDICPHRGVPLHYGRFDGREVECCYHGWRFDAQGRCTAIPSLVEGQQVNLSRIRVRRYPAAERQGNIWLYFGDQDAEPPPPPALPEVEARHAHIAETMVFPCDVDDAVVGLMDPSHGAFVHRSWWWRSRRSMHVKEKRFGPSELGFTMLRHRPSSNSFGYRLLGGAPETEISFRLPGVRIEHIRVGRRVVCGLTAVTPRTARETEVNHVIYWTVPWLTPFTAVLRRFARAFLGQDRGIVALQQEGLAHDPPLMLINDADTQARWYQRLKREYARSQAEGGAFVNPVPETTLRWRS